MLTGKRFRLIAPVPAVDASREKRTVVTIPAGAIIEVICGPVQDNLWMVEVRWDGKVMAMFAEDFEGRAGRRLRVERLVLDPM